MVNKLIPHLLKHVDGIDAPLIALLGKNSHKMSPADFERTSEAVEVIMSWANAVNRTVLPVGIFRLHLTRYSDIVVTQGIKVLFEA